MLSVRNIETTGFGTAIRGMRNPLNSWERSDSRSFPNGVFVIGDNDLDLMRRLNKAGTDHRKFMRMIGVSMDINAPLYWWKEFDTYKIGTVANSCSTMHTIHKKPFEVDDFSHDQMDPTGVNVLKGVVHALNLYREEYLATKDKQNWYTMIQLLPTSYNQLRTVSFNYEVAQKIYKARKDHKLNEWHVLCDTIMDLPYFRKITEE